MHKRAVKKISFFILAIVLVLGIAINSGCNKYYYVDPVSKLRMSDRLGIRGSYNPSTDIVTFFYSYYTDSTDIDTILHGNFVWNKFYTKETAILSNHFENKLYQAPDYVTGKFENGKLHGEIILMKTYWSTPRTKDIDTIGKYNYDHGSLHGPFYLSDGTTARCKGQYNQGRLDGPLYHVHGNGTFNGMELGNTFKWELNYQNGQYDSLQTFHILDTIAEQVYFENGKLVDVLHEQKTKGFQRLANGQFTYLLNRSSLYFSMLGRMFEKDHTSTIRSRHFGDSGFNGNIDFCDGLICDSLFTLDRLIYSPEGYTTETETFQLSKMH
ncbi:MAG: hypothetical protein AAF705_18205 [Bacteroidota bacterium]